MLQEYPKKSRNLKNFQSEDWKIRTNLKRVRETIRNLEQRACNNRQETRKAVQPLRKIKKVKRGPQLQDSIINCRGKEKKECLELLKAEAAEAVEYLSRNARLERQESIAANKKRRTSRFRHSLKKRLKQVITSIMRRAVLHEEVTACISADGKNIETSEIGVAREVVNFYRKWMKSKVHWSER